MFESHAVAEPALLVGQGDGEVSSRLGQGQIAIGTARAELATDDDASELVGPRL